MLSNLTEVFCIWACAQVFLVHWAAVSAMPVEREPARLEDV